MSGLALPGGGTPQNPDWSPKEHDYAVPHRICPHSSGPWGGPVALGQNVGQMQGLSFSRCHRKCAKFITSSDDDPTNTETGALGLCADVVTAEAMEHLLADKFTQETTETPS
jgi:hypothetical protein